MTDQTNKSPQRQRTFLFYVVTPFLFLVALHVVMALFMEQPLIYADELGYTGQARYMAGYAPMPDLRGCKYLFFGYSLLILPPFFIFDDPLTIYKGVLMINAILMSLLYPGLVYLVRVHFEVSWRNSALISLACSFYPACMLQTNLAWSENAFIPLYVLMVALLARFNQRKTIASGLLFGLVTGALYMIHPRALMMLVVVICFLILLALVRQLPALSCLLSITMIVAVYWITRAVVPIFKELGWGASADYPLSFLLARLLHPAEWGVLAEFVIGHIVYLSLATFCLFLLAISFTIMAVISGIRDQGLKGLRDHKTIIMLFSTLTGGIILGTSALLKSFSHHPEDVIHGRYIEGFVALFLALALSGLVQANKKGTSLIKHTVWIILIQLIFSDILIVTRGDALARAIPQYVNNLAIFPYVYAQGGVDLYSITLVSCILFIFLMIMMRKSFPAGVVSLIVLFGVISLFTYQYYFVKEQADRRAYGVLPSLVQEYGHIARLSYDHSCLDVLSFYGYQYLLPHTTFVRYSSKSGRMPNTAFVVTSPDWAPGNKQGKEAVMIYEQTRGNQALWLLPWRLDKEKTNISYTNVNLCVNAPPGVSIRGLCEQELVNHTPVRWSNGVATLKIPIIPGRIPEHLSIHAFSGREEATTMDIRVGDEPPNHYQIFPYGSICTVPLIGLSKSFQVTITLQSPTFIPGEPAERSKDTRELGVMISSIVLHADN